MKLKSILILFVLMVNLLCPTVFALDVTDEKVVERASG